MEGFDLDRYLRTSRKLDLTGLDWDDVSRHPVQPWEARCLAYMMDIESHTVVYLRDLLATRAADEPDVTAFLSCWVYEELWHGEAFSRFLGEAGHRLEPDRLPVAAADPYPSRRQRNAWIRRAVGRGGAFGHLATMAGSAVVGDFVALHMTWGAINELSTLTGYHRLIARTEHPVLVDLLGRIIKDERRHFAFYRAQARLRLSRGRQARKVTRWALERLWAPVGTGVRPQTETDFVIGELFAGPAGHKAVREMDGVIADLPGLGGLRLFDDARTAALARLQREPEDAWRTSDQSALSTAPKPR
ncbi:MAG: ferritin-like domain-containing protein [Nitriliruptorales bacterium]|nr:ferritin-like domain-containing protein [Nitriliruptorales bacterium]